jgi:hypothetical protein
VSDRVAPFLLILLASAITGADVPATSQKFVASCMLSSLAQAPFMAVQDMIAGQSRSLRVGERPGGAVGNNRSNIHKIGEENPI